MNIYRHIAILTLLCILAACTNDIDRLKWVGKEPPMNEVNNPNQKVPPITWPHPMAQVEQDKRAVNSLWNQNSRHFFKDQRARKEGDILTVKVEIKDKATLDNKTERKRTAADQMGLPALFGKEADLLNLIPGATPNPASLISVSADMDNGGEGAIEREEEIETEIAAVITQVLPNGNLVIYGSQDVRVNYEVRQLTVHGVIRPEDITAQNQINSGKIAEARISYGGKGLITDVQQPRLGHQIVDLLSPW